MSEDKTEDKTAVPENTDKNTDKDPGSPGSDEGKDKTRQQTTFTEHHSSPTALRSSSFFASAHTWMAIAAVFAILFIVSLVTGGFSGSSDHGHGHWRHEMHGQAYFGMQAPEAQTGPMLSPGRQGDQPGSAGPKAGRSGGDAAPTPGSSRPVTPGNWSEPDTQNAPEGTRSK